MKPSKINNLQKEYLNLSQITCNLQEQLSLELKIEKQTQELTNSKYLTYIEVIVISSVIFFIIHLLSKL